MNAPILQSASRTVARSAAKTMDNSMAFYPSSAQRLVAVEQSERASFSFYPSVAGATRIPKPQQLLMNQHLLKATAAKPQEPVSKYSRAELDSMFAQSRLERTRLSSTAAVASKPTIEASFAFYPTKSNISSSSSNTTVTTKATAREGSFGFYSTKQQNAVIAAAAPVTKHNASATGKSRTNPEADKDNNMSLLAMGSLVMGIMAQTGRVIARPRA